MMKKYKMNGPFAFIVICDALLLRSARRSGNARGG